MEQKLLSYLNYFLMKRFIWMKRQKKSLAEEQVPEVLSAFLTEIENLEAFHS